jgi:drug/metabolite transporter (DMT)-like permease
MGSVALIQSLKLLQTHTHIGSIRTGPLPHRRFRRALHALRVPAWWCCRVGALPTTSMCSPSSDDVKHSHTDCSTPVLWSFVLPASCLHLPLSMPFRYGIFFYYASRGSLTSLSSLTFLTPVFAAATGYAVLGETLTPMQLTGGAVTLAAVGLINAQRT